MNYNVVSSDDHVQETDDTWAQRVPAKHARPGAPAAAHARRRHLVHRRQAAGGLSLSIQAGHKFEEYRAAKVFWEDARPGCYDPVERLKDMDIDGVDAQVLYPNVGLGRVHSGRPRIAVRLPARLQRFPVGILQHRSRAPDWNRTGPDRRREDRRRGDQAHLQAQGSARRDAADVSARRAAQQQHLRAAVADRGGTGPADAYPSAHRFAPCRGVVRRLNR